MTTPEQNEPISSNEPEHLEAEGYLVRALRRLGEGLGRFVFEKIRDKELLVDEKRSIVTRDLSVIFGKMEPPQNWNRLGLGPDEWNRMGLLIGFRNGPWAHLKGYSDYDVHQCLGDAARLLEAVAADGQAQAVWQMWSELGKLIFDQSTPERPREAESDELRQRISELEKEKSDLLNQNSQVRGQLEGFRSAASLMGRPPASVAPIAPTIVSPAEDGAPSDACPIAPDAARESLRQGDEASNEGDLDRAIANYNRALDLNPRLALAYSNRGNAYCAQEKYDLAIADYDAALRLDSGGVFAMGVYSNRGNVYGAQGEYELAIADYDAALQLDPNNEVAAAVYFNRGNTYSACAEYDLAIADYGAALRLNPNDEVSAGIYFNRGQAFSDKVDYDLAIADFCEALHLNPDLTDVYQDRGFAYFQKGEYDQAVDDFDTALEIDPDDRLARILRGHAYFIKGEYDLSIADCDVAIELNPDLPFAYIIRGMAFSFNDEHDLAIADFESALALEPDDNLAELARRSRRLSHESKNLAVHLREKAEYDRYIEENPRDPQGWYLLGLYNLEREDYFLAVGEFTIAIKYAELGMAPEDAAVWNDRGWAYLQQGEDDLAYDDFSKAIELNPDFATAYYNRAWVWRRRGDHGNAIIDFSQAIALKPDYAAAYQHRGISYFDLGERDKAQADFEMARSLGYEP